MPLYAYRARDSEGALVKGEVEAADKGDVESDLGAKGLIPISVTLLVGDSSAFFEFLLKRTHVDLEALAFFTRQFHALVKSGMDIDSILATLARQSGDRALKKVLVSVRKSVGEGESLAKAMSAFPKVFDGLYLGMVSAGEEAGLLEEVLKEISDVLEVKQKTRAQIQAATFYPKLVSILMAIVISIMMVFVIPKFASFYSNFNATLPLPTRILIGGATLFKDRGYLLLFLFLVGGMGWRVLSSSERVQWGMDRIRLTLPLFGGFYRTIYNARFSRTLASLYRSGISLPRSLELVADVVGNLVFAREVKAVKEEVSNGRSLAQAMEGKAVFSTLLIDSTAVGEKSGTLDQLLLSISDFYAMQTELTVKKLSSVLEPFLLVLIFAFVGLIALAIYIPMFSMGGLAF